MVSSGEHTLSFDARILSEYSTLRLIILSFQAFHSRYTSLFRTKTKSLADKFFCDARKQK